MRWGCYAMIYVFTGTRTLYGFRWLRVTDLNLLPNVSLYQRSDSTSGTILTCALSAPLE